MKNEEVNKTAWLLQSDNFEDANEYCENKLKGSLRIFNTQITNDRNTILQLFTKMEENKKLWNGYRLSSTWLQNMGKIKQVPVLSLKQRYTLHLRISSTAGLKNQGFYCFRVQMNTNNVENLSPLTPTFSF